MNNKKTEMFCLAWLLLLPCLSNSYAQHYGNRFMIAPNNYFNDYSIDRIAQQIYADLYAGTILKIDLRTMAVESTSLHGTAPIFSNKRRLMLYGDTLYNIHDGSSYAINPQTSAINTGGGLSDCFSLNDSNLIYLIPGSPHALNLILSLKDSLLTPVDTNVNAYNRAGPPQWTSDTTFIYAASESCMVEYFIHSRRIDTLVTLHNYNQVVGFAYNTEKDILAYSTYRGGDYPLIYFHSKDSISDFLAFSPLRDDPTCWESGLAGELTSLCWSPQYDKLGFFAYGSINNVTFAYYYSLDSNRIYRVTPCNDPDNKYFLQWANEDTLIYIDNADFHLYGIDISLIDAIQERKAEPIVKDFNVTSYPNPFNPSTTIAVTLPSRTNGVLSIYDVQGRLVKQYRFHNRGGTSYSINWNALNSHNEGVASGFYLAVLRIDGPENQSRKVTKLIYLK